MINQKSHYMPHLDALRALAVMSVIYSHWIPSKYHFFIPWGSAGVQLFFVLSGFLITGILLNVLSKSELSLGKKFLVLKNFLVRRALRIFPAYYVLLLLAYVT